MKYEETPVKNNTKAAGKGLQIKAAEQLSSSRLLFIVVKRHKFGLVVTWAAVVTAVYMFPPLPDVILSLFGK